MNEEKKFEKLFASSMDALFMINKALFFIEINHAMCELFGFSQQEFISKDLPGLFMDPEEYDHFRACMAKDHKIEEFEARLETRDGKQKICLVNLVILPGTGGKDIHYLGVIRDITKRKETERELLKVEKLSMTGKIARSIAHEIRNPLTNLGLALDQLRDELPEDTEDAQMYIGIIERNIERISKLVSNLLSSSKPKEMNRVSLSLNDVIEDTIDLVSDRLKLQKMKIVKDLAKDLPDLLIDPEHLRIALLNLFINAIEAMKPGKGILTVLTSKMDDHVELVIRDNGSGIHPEALEQLFEPFYTTKKKGTGLGLLTVQNIIHGHNARINAGSQLGEGTAFYIQFKVELEFES